MTEEMTSTPELPNDDQPVPDAEPSRPFIAEIPEGAISESAEPSRPFIAETPESAEPESDETDQEPETSVSASHLRGLVEALVFASDKPLKPREIGRLASAPTRQITKVLDELRTEYSSRGIQLDEVAGGWIFRTSAVFAPFVRDLTGQKPVRLSRAQIETVAIVAYRQPITRPEVDDIRGVDSGAVLKMLLERDLVKILGKKDEPGRPILYGTSAGFLELFGLKSLKDLPTLREFTELNEDSKRTVEKELGDVLESHEGGADALIDALNASAEPTAPSDLEDAETESETATETVSETETVSAMETETVSEAETVSETETASATESESATETAVADAESESGPSVSSNYDPADELEFPDDDDDDDDDEDDDEEDEDDDDE